MLPDSSVHFVAIIPFVQIIQNIRIKLLNIYSGIYMRYTVIEKNSTCSIGTSE